MPEFSYYTGKSELLMWLNNLLDLDLKTIEELSNGAVYCQLLDCYYENTVGLHRVNFRAVKDYEVFSNYKIFQAGLDTVGLVRDLKVQGLVKGLQGELLEVLQWLYMTLHKRTPIEGYDAKARRRLTINGGAEKVPLPIWRSDKYDVGHKTDAGKKLVNNEAAMNAPAPRKNVSAKIDTGLRSRKKALRARFAAAAAAGRKTPSSASPGPMPINSHKLPLGGVMPKIKLEVADGYGCDVSSPRIVATPDSFTDKRFTKNKSDEQLMNEIIPACSKSACQAVLAFDQSIVTFRSLVEQIGTKQDTYACRARLKSLRDAMTTLHKHTHLLLDDLSVAIGKYSTSEAPEDVLSARADIREMKNNLPLSKSRFDILLSDLSVKEQQHLNPKGTATVGISDQFRERTETDNIDGALRKIGAAKAALTRALNKITENNKSDSLNKNDCTSKKKDVNFAKNKLEEAEAIIAVGHPDGAQFPDKNEIYRGQYMNAMKCGYGVYAFVNGDMYYGEFADDEMHGYGLYTFSHEGHYEGQWESGVYEGVGTETFALGSTYHGEYHEGSRNGWGVCRYYNGDYYEGQWKEGLREGRGMQQCTDDSNFVGDYFYGKRHGYGVYNFPNGDRYYGEYNNDIPNGHGVYRFSNGQKYEGQWLLGKKHGYCVYTVETNGTWERWAGEWEDGRPNWVESLSKWEKNLPTLSPDVKEKIQKALDACKKAHSAGELGLSRLDEHWKSDGAIQSAIRDVVWRAEKGASNARDAQKKAIEVATRLETSSNPKRIVLKSLPSHSS